ncbi:MAG: MBL fold metallo-hydrolase [Candidatus Cloacimonetes bacterium]|nr:MBL fold metallo-hydrolase [Candidatus Cloacimonadota bacterium]
MIRLKWFGHSMWKISNDNVSIITDPFTDIGYKMPTTETADIILSSHDHFDHNNFELIGGNPEIIKIEGKFNISGINIQTFQTFHDETKGSERGDNLLMKFELDGRTFLHCGDLGHMISDELIEEIGDIDVLMIPIGGHYTIDAKTAKSIADKIDPTIVFPMHYKTDVLDFPIKPVEEYLKLVDDNYHQNSNQIELAEDDFSSNQTITLNYE